MPQEQKQKVVYLDDIPTPYRLGIHRRIRERDLFVYSVLFCAADEPGRDWELDLGGAPGLFTIMDGSQFRPAGQMNPFSFKFNTAVYRELTNRSPDLVVLSGYAHPTMWLAAFWCLRHGVPYGITTESSSQTASRNLVFSAIRWFVIKLLFGRMDFALAVSRRAGSGLKNLIGNEQLRVYPFPNTPDVDQISSIVKKHEPLIRQRTAFDVPVGSEDVVIVFVGRLIEAKRPLDLLAAVAELPDDLQRQLKIFFLGEGPLQTALAKAAEDLAAVVCFCGWISDYERNVTLMASADMMVLPSQHEPWGAVVNEGMAAGACVIASDHVGAAQDMINHGENGFVFPMGDIAVLTATLRHAMTEADLSAIGAAARQTAKQYGSDLAISSVCSIVEEVAGA